MTTRRKIITNKIMTMMMMIMAYNCSFLAKIADNRVTPEVAVTKDELACEYAARIVICKFV